MRALPHRSGVWSAKLYRVGSKGALVNRLLYKPIGLVLGATAGAMAGFLFKQAWHALSHEDSTPNAIDEERGWSEVLAAAALQGAIFAIVKAAIDRGGATGFRRLTGTWPA
jgi:uncharacterized protein DUF4235